MKSLLFSHGKRLYEVRRAFNSKFKTGHKYGYQPVSLDDVSYEYFCLYWRIARPAICERLNVDISADNDPLFLNFSGNRDVLIGNYISAFFRQKLGLAITTTTIRSLVEMEAKRLNRRGVLSTHEQEAIANVSGHSLSSTVKDYYLLEDRESDSRDAAVLFQRLQEERHGVSSRIVENDTSISPVRVHSHSSTATLAEAPASSTAMLVEGSSANAQPHNVFAGSAIQWGANHPCSNKTGYQIEWTDEEKAYIGRIVEEEREMNNGIIPRLICAIIKERVHADVNAHAIFHPHHTVHVTRIRNGYYGYINSVEGRAKKRRLQNF